MTSTETTITSPSEAGNDSGRIRRWLVGFLAFLVFAGLLAGILIRMPYVVFLPGDANTTENILSLDCAEDISCPETFDEDGEIFFTTVAVRQRPSFWEYVSVQFSDDVEILDAEEVLGDRSQEETNEFNAELMLQSKDVAVAVALEALGYEVLNVRAVVVAQVFEDTPSEGLLSPGDRILALDGIEIVTNQDLADVLKGLEPGDEVDVGVDRTVEDETVTELVTLTLEEHPDDASRAFMGIAPVEDLEILDTGLELDIDSADVGGPSAGLAFTLATIDYLSEGDLVGGNNAAVTGTIGPQGYVGQVGGVVQKTVAVREQGIDLFLVPADMTDEVRADVLDAAGDEVEIVEVATLEDALDALKERGGDLDGLENYSP